MRAPRRRGARPRRSPLSETFAGHHNQYSAAKFLNVGIITLNRRKLPYESFYGDRWWKETVLTAHLADLEEAKRQRWMAGQNNRRAAASRAHTSHPTWIDEYGWVGEKGSSQPLEKHPNMQVCKDFLRKIPKDAIRREWHDRAALTYGVADVIGLRPPGHGLTTIDPDDVAWKDTVLWWPSKPGRRRELNVLDIEDRRLEAKRQRQDAISRKMPPIEGP